MDPWVIHNEEQIAGGYRPLPEDVLPALTRGRMINFGYLPSESAPEEHVWLMSYDESYPYVRIVQSVADGRLTYMAADQITLELKDGSDVTELKPALDELGLRLRMFNRKAGIAVVGVLDTDIDAVPRTIEALKPWSGLVDKMSPDYLKIQPKAVKEAIELRGQPAQAN